MTERRLYWPLLMPFLATLVGGTAALGATVSTTPQGAALDERPDWETDGRDWPNRDASRFIDADGIRWHYQRMGQGPDLLLVHGTGAATHSWHRLAPLLARHFRVTAPDLPGHGFTSRPASEQFSLPGMSRLLAQFIEATDCSPILVVGHSAGAAILARMAVDGLIAPRALISVNGALLGPRGLVFQVFAPIVRAVVTTDLAAKVFAWRASDPAVVVRTLDRTGSRLAPDEIERYALLFSKPAHTGATLTMMAKWHLETLEVDLPALVTPVVLVTGSADGFIPPSQAQQLEQLLPAASVVELPGLGHLAHEERPDLIAELILRVAQAQGALPAAGPR